jgi:hypothetical protein
MSTLTRFFYPKQMGCLLLFFLMGLLPAWGKGIAVELDATQIELGQQVRLTLTYDPQSAQGNPDFTVLQKEFMILATEQAMSYTVMNGQARAVGQWSVVLEPKHTGLITIPVLRIGTVTSDPVQLNVNPSTHAAPTTATHTSMPAADLHAALALKVRVDNTHPYLNQEILYKVSLITRHRLLDVQYQPPQVEDAIIVPIGDSQRSQTMRKGVSYHVDEQLYAIFPQKSGPLAITPPSLQALQYDITPQPVTVTGDAVTIQVQPLPKHVSRREWLPSKLVRLQESYDHSDTQLQEGATLVRTIELQAQGLVAQLLPTIPFPDSVDLRSYPEQPENDTRIQQGELWGRSKIKVTYVFPRAGKVVIPAIRVPWFNVKTQKHAIAELPARTYDILSASSSSSSKKNRSLFSKAHQQTSSFLAKTTSRHAPSLQIKPAILLWTAIMVSVVGLFGVICFWQIQKTQALRRLRSACRAHDASRSKIAILDWARQQWPTKDFLHLGDILPLLPESSPLRAALHSLIACVYQSKPIENWRGTGLWHAVKTFKRQSPKIKRQKKSGMPPIHPTRK